MRRVIRSRKPDSLKNNAEQWTEDLLNEIASKGSYAKAEDRFKNRYRQEDIKKYAFLLLL